MQINKLVVNGQKHKDSTSTVEIYEFSGSNRDVVGEILTIPVKDKLLEFEFNDGSTWLCDATTLHEVYPEADVAIQTSGQRGDKANDSFELPAHITVPGSERGVVGKIVVKLLKVFAKKAEVAGIGVLAKKFEDKCLINGLGEIDFPSTGAVTKELIKEGVGLFRIDKDFKFHRIEKWATGQPYFLFIHGTNSDTFGAFKELKASATWVNLHNQYGNNVIAFQHRTLTQSPLENVVKLAKLLPTNIKLHIISHSRGGIVGDLVSLYSGSQPVGFSNENIELLKKENREKDIENIKELNKIFKSKRIEVAKFIRVACPAAGTKLASQRLDHILNAFFNLFGGDLNPFADVLKELLSAAVASKDNINVLPGLEAQNPESPFIKILNDQSSKNAIDGSSLAVISGNGTFSFTGKGILVILGKLFYWQRNDLVVNTDSMYLGVKRKSNIQYFFDQGTDVDHVKYFANTSTREAINFVLNTAEGEAIPSFKSMPQNAIPASDRGLEHGELSSGPPSGNRPIAVILPGIMGSNISRGNNKLWLNYLSAIVGGLTKLKDMDDGKITATSAIKTSYGKLAARLSNNYDVVIYPFDWRKNLNECAKEFNTKIKSLLQLGQPIKIIGHSMGGVLVRDFIINYNDTWQQLNNSKGFRLLFLGSPLGGSYRIPTVLYGQDSIITSLNRLDFRHSKKELLQMFSKFPGILSLLPLTTDNENNFALQDTWKKMASFLGDNGWPIPTTNDLEVFRRYRDNIISNRDNIDYTNMVYIAGQDKQTPCGYFNDTSRNELVFLYTAEGDQSVTWKLGIPKQLEDKNAVYYVPVSHGALANEPDIFNGIEEILVNGTTTLLSKLRPVTRGEGKLFRAFPEFNFELSEQGVENAIFGIEENKETVVSKVPVTVSVSNGDLGFAAYPVLAGHFANDGILYAENIIDQYLDGMLSAKHRLGLYPGEIGTNEVFVKNKSGTFMGAVITGLGEPGKLTSFQLAKTIEQGVSNYLLSIKDQPVGKAKIGISTLIIGCGYGGLSVESSLKAIIEGVNNANEKSLSIFKKDSKTVQHIEFVELYLDRALSSMYVLSKISNSDNLNFNIILPNKKIKNLLGLKKRLPLDTSEDWWNRITVKYKPAKEGSADPSSIVFGATTGEAREEENELFSSTPLIDLFIAEVSTKNKWSPDTAKTLFELMIPNDFKEKLKRKGNISWVLDKDTAAYPWELLQDNTVNAKPLCINAGMIRQLAISDYNSNIKRVAEENALVVADPNLYGFIHQLPGAVAEGREVVDILNNNGYNLISLINNDAADIIGNLFSKDYTIIHLAGHGVYDPKSIQKSGMVLGNDVFLTVYNIQQLPVIPELVFVNCCHLGNINALDEKYYADRYKLAANIGTELIRIGVKVVIAAGWAVDDEAAKDFAKIFYTSMFEGYNFGDAVKKAREEIFTKHKNNNTWGAYQCYGDPFYKLRRVAKTKKAWKPQYFISEEAEIDLENLLNQLQTGKGTIVDNLHVLEAICKAVDDADLRNAQITEKEALINLEMALYEKAVAKFETLLNSEIASFSFSSMEKYCNARAKFYIHTYFKNANSILKKQSDHSELLKQMEKVITDLNMLNAAGETAERLNIIASSYKRKAILESSKKGREDAYKAAAYYYNKAAVNPANANKIYSVTNAIELECILVLGGMAAWGSSFKVLGNNYTMKSDKTISIELENIKTSLMGEGEKDSLNYWDMVAFINIDLCLLLAKNKITIKKQWDEISIDFKKIWEKAGSAGKKIAEMEHLQFLSHALLSVKSTGKIEIKKIDVMDEQSVENFTAHLETLRLAFEEAMAKTTPADKGNLGKRGKGKVVKK